MGLLDDAIREHLELKRQHGAPEQEVQRQEEEALGPARRDVAPAEGDVEQAAEHEETGVPEEVEAAAAEPAIFDSAGEAAPPDRAAFEAPPAEPDVLQPDTGAFEQPAAEPDALQPDPEAPQQQETMLHEPEPAAPADSDSDSDSDEYEPVFGEPAGGGTPARGFEAVEEEDHVVDHDGDPDELDENGDVLEDTPDFLQETPEHDRLWFEQKPPRDFDFD